MWIIISIIVQRYNFPAKLPWYNVHVSYLQHTSMCGLYNKYLGVENTYV